MISSAPLPGKGLAARESRSGPRPDAYGRIPRKLRVSLTDACNYRCFYCMPAHPVFTPGPSLLSPAEYRAICKGLSELGLEELRVTGGEPTVRPEFLEIIASLADLPFRRRGLTTNGHHLRRHLDFLREAGWDNINISVDSLDPGKFARITGGGDLRIVLDALERAVVLGFEVKVNAVMFKGVNDDELADFAAWSAQTGIEVRFLEYMKIGPQFESYWNRFISAAEMMDRLAMEFTLSPAPAAPDATAFIRVTDQGGRLGFIASESQPFCGTCSRLRLSATGMLRSCLMREQGISIRHAPREGYPEILEQVQGMKPAGRLHHVDQPMHAIGG